MIDDLIRIVTVYAALDRLQLWEKEEDRGFTFAVFFVAPALLWGKGAGAAFLPCLGGCH